MGRRCSPRPLSALARLVAVTALGTVGLGAGLAAMATPAGAVGDNGLTSLIVANPVPGWQPESIGSLQRVVSYINGLENDAVVPKGGRPVTAVRGWIDPADHSHYLVVALVALTFPGQSTNTVVAKTQQGAIGALTSLCAGVALQSSVQAATVSQVPGSHTLTCTLRSDGSQPYAASFAHGNVLALVLSLQGAISPATMTSVVSAQYGALLSDGFIVRTTGGGSSTLSTVLFILAGVIVLVIAGAAIYRVLQRASLTVPVPEVEVRRGVVQRDQSAPGGATSAGGDVRPPTPPQP